MKDKERIFSLLRGIKSQIGYIEKIIQSDNYSQAEIDETIEEIKFLVSHI